MFSLFILFVPFMLLARFALLELISGVLDDSFGDPVRGGQYTAGALSDEVGVSLEPSGDVADAVGAGVESEDAGDHVSDALGLDLALSPVLVVLGGGDAGVHERVGRSMIGAAIWSARVGGRCPRGGRT